MTRSKKAAPAFAFNLDLLPDENIELFYTHLKSVDVEMAEILNTNVAKMLPFPEDAQKRTPLRTAFHKSVMTGLEKISIPIPNATILPYTD